MSTTVIDSDLRHAIEHLRTLYLKNRAGRMAADDQAPSIRLSPTEAETILRCLRAGRDALRGLCTAAPSNERIHRTPPEASFPQDGRRDPRCTCRPEYCAVHRT